MSELLVQLNESNQYIQCSFPGIYFFLLILTYMYKPLTHPAKRFSNLLPDFLLFTAFKIPFYFSQTLNRRYSNHAADVKKLKLAEARIQVNVAFFLVTWWFNILCNYCEKTTHKYNGVYFPENSEYESWPFKYSRPVFP